MEYIAKTNTYIYKTVFACVPDNSVQSSRDYIEFKETKNLSLYEEFKDDIKGFVV